MENQRLSSFCKNYFWEDFYKIANANKRIDIRNIDFDLLNAAIFHATNEQRTKRNLPEFLFHNSLFSAANLHSSCMSRYNFFNHNNNRNRDIKTHSDRIKRYKGYFNYTGENIVYYTIYKVSEDTYTSKRDQYGKYRYYQRSGGKELKGRTYINFARKVVKMWMYSKGHRENILNKKYKYLGCAVILKRRSGKTKTIPMAYATQNFGGEILSIASN